MNKVLIGLLFVVGSLFLLGGILGLYVMGVNNQLAKLDVAVSQKLSEIQNIYQLRADTIGNLVETVKGAAGHERETLEGVIRARASATAITLTPEALKDPEAMRRFEQAQTALSGTLSRLMVTSERYPDLKANVNFLRLQKSLMQIEVNAAKARTNFNTTVGLYNNRVRVFPANMIAGLFGYTPKAFFAAAPGADVAPKVDFSKPTAEKK